MKILLKTLFCLYLISSSSLLCAQDSDSAATDNSQTTEEAPATTKKPLSKRVKNRPAHAFGRGANMQQVLAKWGEPAEKLAPAGGQKPQWPVINRWVYPEFTVFFEKSRVIDIVSNSTGKHLDISGM